MTEFEFPLDDAMAALWQFERHGRKDAADGIRRALRRWAGFFARKAGAYSIRRTVETEKPDFPLPFDPDEAVLDAAQVLAGGGNDASPFLIADTRLPWLAGLEVSDGWPIFKFFSNPGQYDYEPVYGLTLDEWFSGAGRFESRLFASEAKAEIDLSENPARMTFSGLPKDALGESTEVHLYVCDPSDDGFGSLHQLGSAAVRHLDRGSESECAFSFDISAENMIELTAGSFRGAVLRADAWDRNDYVAPLSSVFLPLPEGFAADGSGMRIFLWNARKSACDRLFNEPRRRLMSLSEETAFALIGECGSFKAAGSLSSETEMRKFLFEAMQKAPEMVFRKPAAESAGKAG